MAGSVGKIEEDCRRQVACVALQHADTAGHSTSSVEKLKGPVADGNTGPLNVIKLC
jgi:hypothetical protein